MARPRYRSAASALGAPESSSTTFAGVAKVNMSTGELESDLQGRAPGNGAMLATAGDLVFWGDLDEKFGRSMRRAERRSGRSTLPGAIQNSTITYAVNGKQYVAVFTGEGALTGGLIDQAGLQPTRRHNAVYVFALTVDEVMQNAKCRMQNAKGSFQRAATSPAHDHLAFCILHYVGRRSYGCSCSPSTAPASPDADWPMYSRDYAGITLFAAHPDQPRERCAAHPGLDRTGCAAGARRAAAGCPGGRAGA